MGKWQIIIVYCTTEYTGYKYARESLVTPSELPRVGLNTEHELVSGNADPIGR